MAIDPIERGKLIRNRRQAMEWSQQELADRTGVSRNSVSYWESGTTIEIEFPHALELANHLNIEIDELVDDIPVAWKRLYLQDPSEVYVAQPGDVSQAAQDIAYMWDRIDPTSPIKDLIRKTIELEYETRQLKSASKDSEQNSTTPA